MSTLIKPQLSEPTLKKPITETWAYSSFAALLAPLAQLVLAADAAACGFYSAYAQYQSDEKKNYFFAPLPTETIWNQKLQVVSCLELFLNQILLKTYFKQIIQVLRSTMHFSSKYYTNYLNQYLPKVSFQKDLLLVLYSITFKNNSKHETNFILINTTIDGNILPIFFPLPSMK